MGLLYVVMPVLKVFLPYNAIAKGPLSMHGAGRKRGTKQARHAPKPHAANALPWGFSACSPWV